MKFLITGGAGFIGSAVIRNIINNTDYQILNIDKLTYAGNLDTLKSVSNNKRYSFKKIVICSSIDVREIFNKFQPDNVIHLAAESHVDRSIDTPEQFIQTNIFGTYNLLQEAKNYLSKINKNKTKNFRFVHVSTDEVYGDLKKNDKLFTEKTAYAPSSPYAASKASSDHLVRAWHRTYKFPSLITNCSNNYGPYQFPEKLIPVIILNALEAKNIPVYGDGKQIRDWLYVEDHAEALLKTVLNGKIGETYNIGGHNEIKNIDVVKTICRILEKIAPVKPKGIKMYEQLITHVEDRSGHDIRYAIDASKIYNELNWKPKETFETGIEKTVMWYLNNNEWCKQVKDGKYKGERLGLLK